MRLPRVFGILAVVTGLVVGLVGTASAAHQIEEICVNPSSGVMRDGTDGCASYEAVVSPPLVACVNPLSRVMRLGVCAYYEFAVLLEGDGSDPVAVNPLSKVIRYTANPAYYEHAATI